MLYSETFEVQRNFAFDAGYICPRTTLLASMMSALQFLWPMMQTIISYIIGSNFLPFVGCTRAISVFAITLTKGNCETFSVLCNIRQAFVRAASTPSEKEATTIF